MTLDSLKERGASSRREREQRAPRGLVESVRRHRRQLAVRRRIHRATRSSSRLAASRPANWPGSSTPRAVATVNPATNSKLPPMATDAFDKTSRRALLTLTSRTCAPLLQGIKRHGPEAQSPPPAQPALGRLRDWSLAQ